MWFAPLHPEILFLWEFFGLDSNQCQVWSQYMVYCAEIYKFPLILSTFYLFMSFTRISFYTNWTFSSKHM